MLRRPATRGGTARGARRGRSLSQRGSEKEQHYQCYRSEKLLRRHVHERRGARRAKQAYLGSSPATGSRLPMSPPSTSSYPDPNVGSGASTSACPARVLDPRPWARDARGERADRGSVLVLAQRLTAPRRDASCQQTSETSGSRPSYLRLPRVRGTRVGTSLGASREAGRRGAAARDARIGILVAHAMQTRPTAAIDAGKRKCASARVNQAARAPNYATSLADEGGQQARARWRGSGRVRGPSLSDVSDKGTPRFSFRDPLRHSRPP